MPIDTLLDQTRATLARHALLAPGQRVLAAVSGGPDSVCLLDALQRLGYAVAVAHVDHQTRAGDSAEDAAFVRALCEARGVPCHTLSRPVAEEAAASGEGFEAYARRVRYDFFAEVAQREGIDAIATGHHADDQAETVLLRLLRGTGLTGLGGIPYARPLTPGLRVVRPLLDCPRGMIEAYLDAAGLFARRDASNEDPAFLRNRVRHGLLPALEREGAPTARQALSRLAEIAREEDAYLETAAAAFEKTCLDADGAIDRAAFAQGPIALQRRALAHYLRDLGAEVAFERIDAARRFIRDAATGQQYDAGAGILLRAARDHVEPERPGPAPDACATLSVPGETTFGGRIYRAELIPPVPLEDIRRHCSPTRQLFDADALGPTLTLRYPRPGDRFSPFGLGGRTKKLQDYFTDLHISAARRPWIPLLTTPDDAIAWVIGHAPAETFAMTKEQRHRCLSILII